MAPAPSVFGPGDDQIAEGHIRSSFIALQSALPDKLVSKASKSEPISIVAEAWSSDDRKPYIRETRCVAVSMCQTKIHHVANNERG